MGHLNISSCPVKSAPRHLVGFLLFYLVIKDLLDLYVSPESTARLFAGDCIPLRKQAYSNILKILSPKKWTFSDKNSDIFHISAQNIDCGYSLEPPRRGGSNEYPEFMFFEQK